MLYRLYALPLLVLMAATPVGAQWRSETFDLAPGWQAIYLSVDTGDETIAALLGSHPQVTEIWRWRPDALDPRIVDAPEAPVTGTEWLLWKAGDITNSSLSVLSPHAGYLVRVADGAAPFRLSLKGTVKSPTIRWRTDGLNLLGFPTNPQTPPTASAFFGPSELLEQPTEIYGYRGGPLVTDVNPGPLVPRFATVKRGSAYWIRTNKYSDYDGPLRVRAAVGEGLSFGSEGSTVRLVLTNRTDRVLGATLAPVPSEPAPGDQSSPVPVPLTRATENESGATVFIPFGASHSVTLAPREARGLTLGLDRGSLPGQPGDFAYSLLKVTDSEGLSEVYLPASAEVSSLAGLWAGRAEITHVQNQLQRFQKDSNGDYVVGADGRHVPEYRTDSAGNAITDADGNKIPVADSGLTATAQVFSLTIILHVDPAGRARLLSQAYLGAVAEDAAGAPVIGVATSEDALLDAHLESAARLSAVHLPRGTNLALAGAFAVGAPLTGSLAIAHNSPANPFIHPYHPDHDNLDARFENQLPPGVESFRIDRTIALRLDAGPGEIGDPSWGTTLVTGAYTETIAGLHKNPVAVSGVFALRRLTDIPALTSAP